MSAFVAILLLLTSLGSLAPPEARLDLQAQELGREQCIGQETRMEQSELPGIKPSQADDGLVELPCAPASGSLGKAPEEAEAAACASETPPTQSAWTRFAADQDHLSGAHLIDTSGQLSCQTLQSRHVRMQV